MNSLTTYQDHPLRILQVHTLYPTYVPYYYSFFPQISSQKYATQVQALYEHGLQEMYMVAPLLQKMGCETQLIYSNAHHAQRAWCKENGYALDVFTRPNWEQEIVAAQIENFKPDVLFFTDNHHFDGHFLEKLSFHPKLIVGWRHAPMDLSTYWQGFDIILSGSRRFVNLATHLGAKKSIEYFFGLPTTLRNNTEERKRDLFFCGTYCTPFAPHCHSKRRQLLDRAAHICQQQKARFDLFLSDVTKTLPKHLQNCTYAPLYGKAMYAEIAKSHMGIDILGNATAKIQGQSILQLTAGDTVNMRLVEHVACGTLAFAEHRGRLARYFEPMQEVITYTTIGDFETKLQYYLQHKEEAANIAVQGTMRLRKEYNQTKTLHRLLEIFQQGLREKEYYKEESAQNYLLPWPTVEKMLKLLEKTPYSMEGSAWELEEALFHMACALAVRGEYAAAQELDGLLNRTAFVQADMGYLAALLP